MKSLKYFFAPLLLAGLFTSCSKEEEVVIPSQAAIAAQQSDAGGRAEAARYSVTYNVSEVVTDREGDNRTHRSYQMQVSRVAGGNGSGVLAFYSPYLNGNARAQGGMSNIYFNGTGVGSYQNISLLPGFRGRISAATIDYSWIDPNTGLRAVGYGYAAN